MGAIINTSTKTMKMKALEPHHNVSVLCTSVQASLLKALLKGADFDGNSTNDFPTVVGL